MGPDIVAILAYALVPALALVAGGAIAAVRPPGTRLRGLLQHIAAGVVFAAVAGELLPQELEEHRPPPVVLGFAVGIALMLVIRRLTEGAGPEGAGGSGGSGGLVVTVGVDVLIDGLLVGIGFAAGAETGILITVALTFEVLFLGLATVASLTAAGAPRQRVLAVVAGFALVLMVGAALGGVALRGLSGDPFLAVLGFGSAALLYLVVEELLVEAHEAPEGPVSTAAFFVGFLVIFVIEMLV